ncbi:glucomannan 4-beta-mannosyltransferase 2-like [Phalaenopsis equestris]|uniref:glucomannan 4-beta-mannosyltransferase 2-like n=1 Tax=Phalaenopsis equestris TaxID=78828 RepID=UPI0009E2878E|nr:glucomannan 4-beta-mannosyltransferase 2-like [Phalaenopsis equestris]
MREFGGLHIDFERFGWELHKKWKQTRVIVVVPLLRVAVLICLIMTLILLTEKLFVGLVCLVVKVFGLKPEKRYRWKPMSSEASDLEAGASSFPMVLVQIPMYNEKEVYKLSIGAACNLDWPTERMIIQVLDDSTDPVVKA